MTAIATLITIVLIALFGAEGAAPVSRVVVESRQPVALAEASVGCDHYAAPSGSDRRRGTRQRPFRSVPRLLRALHSDETGCLLPGRYRHGEPARLRRPGARLVGIDGHAHVDGPIWITERATGAEIRGLDITASDPTYFIPLKVQADRARIVGNRIRGARSTSCLLVGSTRRTRGVRIEQNWIHRCGRRGKLDHLIYVHDAVGTRIRGNVLSGNPGGWAVHLFPNGDRSVIESNLIDRNQGGVIFGGEGRWTSDGNVVRANVITFSSPRWNVEGSWSDEIGVGNVAYGNCLYSTGADAPAGIGPQVGFLTGPNLTTAASPYSIRTLDSYGLRRSSPCARLVAPLPAALPGSGR